MWQQSSIVENDLKEITCGLKDKIKQLEGKKIIITGGGGFLGYYLIQTLLYANETIFSTPCKVVCIDNFIRGKPEWLITLEKKDHFTAIKTDSVTFDYNGHHDVDYIIHAASIASPLYYRQYPIETMDANVNGLRNILEFCKNQIKGGKGVSSILFFSSSEIYGDPPAEEIPTTEDFRGLVSSTGPRACYDESKRYGETLSVNFHKVYHVPIKIVRPFNNYGPGLSIDDKRVIPDFCKNVLEENDIVLLSDGSPKRTFCYISDAIGGYFSALLSDHDGEAFNIGIEKPEVSMLELAQLIRDKGKELFAIDVSVQRKKSNDKDYLTDNPIRRCPSIEKAKTLLNYKPQVTLEEGIIRTLQWYKENQK